MTSYHPFYHIAEIERLARSMDFHNDAEMFRRGNPAGLWCTLVRLFAQDIRGNEIYKLTDSTRQQIEQQFVAARAATTEVGQQTIDRMEAHLKEIVNHKVTIYRWPCGTWCYACQLNDYSWMSDDYEKLDVTVDELAAM